MFVPIHYELGGTFYVIHYHPYRRGVFIIPPPEYNGGSKSYLEGKISLLLKKKFGTAKYQELAERNFP